ncbi:HXXEE domain-containing protein [Anaeromicropila herbilytica]|uniref:Membrane protein n=1 Tax=Anaeromicropila herbilytica TaxID=2785025 RepID=A0A7R7EM42_9FIRM|nr:HXXEE domain-containing protein [Anaeromicropila herbilytica]BCN31022.1 membrane protein [Anaeromicropila herbilytica]
MYNMQIMIWLFPILFIFHDFEEIIFMKVWIRKNREYLSERFPSLSKRLLPHFDRITTASFALGVAEEYIIISVITVVSYMTHWYSLWVGLFIAFTLHLIIHCVQVLIVRRYVPAIVTSVICLPVCIYMIQYVMMFYMLDTVILYSVVGLVIMVVNLVFVHRGMDVFDKWLVRYEKESK